MINQSFVNIIMGIKIQDLISVNTIQTIIIHLSSRFIDQINKNRMKTTKYTDFKNQISKCIHILRTLISCGK